MKRKNNNQANSGSKKFKSLGAINQSRRQFNVKNHLVSQSLIQNPIPNPGYLDFNEPQSFQSIGRRVKAATQPENRGYRSVPKRLAHNQSSSNRPIRRLMPSRLAPPISVPPRFLRTAPPPPPFRPPIPPMVMRRPLPPLPLPMFVPPVPFGSRFNAKKAANLMKAPKIGSQKKVLPNRKAKNVNKYQGQQYPLDKPWVTEEIKALHVKKLDLENRLKGKKDDKLFDEYKTVTHTFIQMYNSAKEKEV